MYVKSMFTDTENQNCQKRHAGFQLLCCDVGTRNFVPEVSFESFALHHLVITTSATPRNHQKTALISDLPEGKPAWYIDEQMMGLFAKFYSQFTVWE